MLLQPISPMKNFWKYLLALPLLTIVFFACQAESEEVPFKEIASNDLKEHALIPTEDALGEVVDTIITFDPDTGEETIQVVKKTQRNEEVATNVIEQQTHGADYITDTIINFDPETYKETMTLVKTPYYKEVDQMPTFGDCPNLSGEELKNCSQNALLTYIYNNVKYPEKAAKEGIEGTALTKFVVRTDGYIDAIEIERNVSPNIDAEILKVLNKMQNEPKVLWKPGIKDGEKVNVQFVLPIKFKLE